MKASKIQTVGFDYSGLDKETAGKLQYYSTSGLALVRKSQIRFIAEFGEMLSDARKLLSHHGDGMFCKWATGEFDLSRQTVYNYVNAWDRCLSIGVTNYDNISPTALYLLSRDDTPKPVRTKVLRLAGKQTTVTKSDVKSILNKGGEKNDPEPSPPESDEPIDDDSEPVPDPEDTPEDYGKCPNCAGERWKVDGDGLACMKCNHPHGEPAGDVDEERIKTQRQKSRKTVEALMRAIADLHHLKPSPVRCAKAIKDCKRILAALNDWE